MAPAADSVEHAELLVIGAGPGGYVAAIRGARAGLDVTLVDRDAMGGTCLNYGCIPSKALLSVSNRVDQVVDAESMGVYADPYIDFGELTSWKDGVVDQLTGGVESLCRDAGVTVIEGHARFADDQTAHISIEADDDFELSFEHAIIATGSRPVTIPGFPYEADPIIDSRQALDLDSVPDSLVIVGAGYIGLELATVFARLGTKVHVVEMLASPLPRFDAELTEPVVATLRALDAEFHFGYRASDWTATDTGVVLDATDDGGETLTLDADRILVAVGREPVTDSLDLDAVGVPTTDQGYIEVDASGATALGTIYAIGDVTGEPMLAHAASAEATKAVDDIRGVSDGSVGPVPEVVFTDPEIATAGAAPGDLEDALVGRFPFAASGRALAAGHDSGFVRIVADPDTHAVIGAQVVGSDASELIGELALAITAELPADALAETIHAHPTLSEAIAEAAEAATGSALHRP